MPDMQSNILPAILLSSVEGVVGLSLARGLLAKGFPVIAACIPSDSAAAEAERGEGAVILDVSKENALRTGLEFFKKEMPGLPGIVWVDAEAGYALSDILAVADALATNPGMMALAARSEGKFEGRVAHWSFAVAHGRQVLDPWSGLVGLPANHVDDFLGEKGGGRSYLFRLLLTMQRHRIKAVNVPVDTPYRRGRDDTTKGRVLDIVRIALMPLLFISSSLTLTAADYSMRFFFFYVLLQGNEPVSLAVGRFTGALVGYIINRSVVFRHKDDSLGRESFTLLKYALLVVCNYYAAHLMVSYMMNAFRIEFALASVVADLLLYAPNYLIQRDVVFRRKLPRPA